MKTENYLLYTGNLYPHKNITIVFKALKLPKIKLKIICARSVYPKIEAQIKREKLTSQVEFLGFVPDSFSKLYSHALALVHPSLMEGFSLTGLEAMALNCPVIAASAYRKFMVQLHCILIHTVLNLWLKLSANLK